MQRFEIAGEPFGLPAVRVDQKNPAAIGIDRVHDPRRILNGDLLPGDGAGAQFVGQHLQAHQALDPRHKLRVVDRFVEEVVRARLEALDAIRDLVERGNHDDGNVMGARIGLQPPADFETVHLRHHHVQQDDIDMTLGADAQGFGAGIGWRDLKILGGQPGIEQLHIRWDIVDHQHAGCHGTASLKTLHTRCASARDQCSLQSFPKSETPRSAWIYSPRIRPAECVPRRPSWRRR